MASTYTTNTGIELITTGEQSGTWGDTTNVNLQIIDRLTNGVGSITLSGTTHTLTTTDGTLSDGQYAVLVFGGSPSGTNTVTVSPNDQQKVFIVKNGSGQTVVLTQGSGGNVTLLNGDSKIVYCDGAGASAAVVDVTGDLALSDVNIDGGSIDGVTLGTNSPATEAQIDNLNLNGNAITSTNTNGNIAITPNGTGEVDISKVDIDGGTIDGTVVGGSTPAAGGFTNITVTGTVDGRDVAADGTKLDGIEASADVTDTANVTAAGALMDSELTDITAVKALDQGVATTDSPTFAEATITGDLIVDTDTLFVDASTNNVGIGTSSPDHALDVSSTSGIIARFTNGASGGTPSNTHGELVVESGGANLGVQLLGTSTSNQKILFGDPVSSGSGQIVYDHSSNHMALFTSATERLRINSSGNVGIGTSSPGSKLSVVGLPTSSAGLSAGDIYIDAGTLKIVT